MSEYEIPGNVRNALSRAITSLLQEKPQEATKFMELLEEIKSQKDLELLVKSLKEFKIVVPEVKEFIEIQSQLDDGRHITRKDEDEISESLIWQAVKVCGQSPGMVADVKYDMRLNSTLYLTRQIMEKHNKTILLLPKNKKVNGKIISVEWRGIKKIPILNTYTGMTEDQGIIYKTVFYTEEKPKSNDKFWRHRCELTEDYYAYRFWSPEEDREYLVLSHKEIKNIEEVECIEGTYVCKTEELSKKKEFSLKGYANIIHLHEFHRGPSSFEIIKKHLTELFTKASSENGGVIKSTHPSEKFGDKIDNDIIMNNDNIDSNTLIYSNTIFNDNNDLFSITARDGEGTVTFKIDSFKKVLDLGIFNIYRHPEWFERMIYAWMFSSIRDKYPLHVFVFQKGAGGKSTMMQRLATLIGIPHEDIWDGDKSTVTSLTANYHRRPPDPGWMPRQRHFGFLDEFFGRKKDNTGQPSQAMNEYDALKSELVSSPSLGRSGMGNIQSRTTARFLFASNYKYGVNDLESFMRRTDPAFVERLLVYCYTQDHYEFIKREKPGMGDKEELPLILSLDFYKHLILWSQSFTVKKIKSNVIDKMKDRLITDMHFFDNEKIQAVKDYADARLVHHMWCLLDGIVKTRYFMKGKFTEDMEAIDEDYEMLEMMMGIVAGSWMNDFNITNFSKKARVGLLGSGSKVLYDFIMKSGGKIDETDLLHYALDVNKMDKEHVTSSFNQLRDWRLVSLVEGVVTEFQHRDFKNEPGQPEHGVSAPLIKMNMPPTEGQQKIDETPDSSVMNEPRASLREGIDHKQRPAQQAADEGSPIGDPEAAQDPYRIALNFIKENKFCTQEAVAEHLGIKNAQSIVDQLMRDGHVYEPRRKHYLAVHYDEN